MNSTTKYQNDINFCKSLKTLFITSITLSAISVLGFILMVASGAFAAGFDPAGAATAISVIGVFGILFFLPGLLATFVINLIYAIKLLSHQFDNKKLNEQKIIWGIFTIVILGFIAMIVWTCVSKNILEHAIKTENNQNQQQATENNTNDEQDLI